jgi:hypothetical protein
MEAAVSKSGIKTLEHMLHEVRECRPEEYDGLIMISAKRNPGVRRITEC